MSLGKLLERSAERTPDAPAIRAPDGTLDYRGLDELSGRAAAALRELGVRRGDRVGIHCHKSLRAVAAMQGTLRLGASFVPIDPLGPATRTASIARDCEVAALVTTGARARELSAHGVSAPVLDVGSRGLDGASGIGWPDLEDLPPLDCLPARPDELAYVLYTSGSTGDPKGVCLTHENALAFVTWAAGVLEARPDDRFSNHAPFHFDLSVLDLYVPATVGASVSLVPQAAAYSPARLVDILTRDEISVWYSVPSVLILMMEHGRLLDASLPALRAIVFAGEPFPVAQLGRLRTAFRSSRLFNFYGPTETNVCTYYEVPTDFGAGDGPLPIGSECCGDVAWARRADGMDAKPGEEGELMVAGPTVMRGYWGREPLGDRPYATGDVVRVREDGSFVYLGRRDHMLKVRGHRMEPAEIERVLCAHPHISRAAVMVRGRGPDARLVAFLVAEGRRPSLLELKRHSATHLPVAMVVDETRYLDRMPLNGNGKTDRRALQARLSERLAPAEGTIHAGHHTRPS